MMLSTGRHVRPVRVWVSFSSKERGPFFVPQGPRNLFGGPSSCRRLLLPTFVSASALGLPIWLLALAVLALLAVLLLAAFIGCLAVRRADRKDLSQVLLGLSHVISSMCGLLPWGRPSSPPPLSATESGSAPSTSTVVVMQANGARNLVAGERVDG
jgi:hypothetical protein